MIEERRRFEESSIYFKRNPLKETTHTDKAPDIWETPKYKKNIAIVGKIKGFL